MTLHTRVWLTGPIDGPTAFDCALRAILTAANKAHLYDTAKIVSEPEGKIPDWTLESVIRGQKAPEVAEVFRRKSSLLKTVRGQGLPAIVFCHYKQDGSPVAPEERVDEEDGYLIQRACTVELSWDTGYSYRDALGSCYQLHARALQLLSKSLPDVSMVWEDEHTGTAYDNVSPESLANYLNPK